VSGESGAKGPPHTHDDEQPAAKDVLSGVGELERRAMLTWVGEHLPEVRRSAYGQRILYWTLGIGFVVGLAAYVGGYALRSSVTTEPLEFVGDLLYTLGWALWTGVVVVLFLQVLPEAKRRGYKQLLEAYETTLSDEARAEGERTPGNNAAPMSS
jgi:GNAT superfamily N-acetyltransferase